LTMQKKKKKIHCKFEMKKVIGITQGCWSLNFFFDNMLSINHFHLVRKKNYTIET
jgi:hypothetical protein